MAEPRKYSYGTKKTENLPNPMEELRIKLGVKKEEEYSPKQTIDANAKRTLGFLNITNPTVPETIPKSTGLGFLTIQTVTSEPEGIT